MVNRSNHVVVFLIVIVHCTAFSPFQTINNKKCVRNFVLHDVSSKFHNHPNQNDTGAALVHKMYNPSATSDTQRRIFLQSITCSVLLASMTTAPSVCHAGELGERLNRAVTQSDLGIQVRREVVKGAQILDQLDGKWEQWSDKFQLGTERSKQAKLPSPKSIPPLRPLDTKLAQQCLQLCDQVFVDHTKVSKKELEQTIQRIAHLVQPSFERAGLKTPAPPLLAPSQPALISDNKNTADIIVNAEQFNFWSYVHFRAYAELLLTTTTTISQQLQRQSDKNNYAKFKTRLEEDLGKRLLGLLAPNLASASTAVNDAAAFTTAANQQQTLQETSTSSLSASSHRRWPRLQSSLARVDVLLSNLVQAGFVASTDTSQVDEEQLEDWKEGLSDLTLSIALDGDVTLGAQTLLQEQGYRLYPNYAKWAVATLLSQSGETVQVDDYYFDTDYNPDPNQYQVKEVLLNVVVQSS
jgi:hypothetical protein